MPCHSPACRQAPALRCTPRPAPAVFKPFRLPADGALSDQGFLTLLGRYRAHGGLARAGEVSTRLERGLGLDADALANWRADRRVICFRWRTELWLPWFQFVRADHLPDPAVSEVLGELVAVFDDGQVAAWFGASNAALADRAPVDVIRQRPAEVFTAARRDRFMVAG